MSSSGNRKYIPILSKSKEVKQQSKGTVLSDSFYRTAVIY